MSPFTLGWKDKIRHSCKSLSLDKLLTFSNLKFYLRRVTVIKWEPLNYPWWFSGVSKFVHYDKRDYGGSDKNTTTDVLWGWGFRLTTMFDDWSYRRTPGTRVPPPTVSWDHQWHDPVGRTERHVSLSHGQWVYMYEEKPSTYEIWLRSESLVSQSSKDRKRGISP